MITIGIIGLILSALMFGLHLAGRPSKLRVAGLIASGIGIIGFIMVILSGN